MAKSVVSKPLSLQEKHDLAQRKVAKFTLAVSLPNLTPGEMALAVSMLRSARAELKLSHKALEYAKPHSDPEVEQRLRLYAAARELTLSAAWPSIELAPVVPSAALCCNALFRICDRRRT